MKIISKVARLLKRVFGHEEKSETRMDDRSYRQELSELITNSFGWDELLSLCFHLGVDMETLSGDKLEDKVQAIVLWADENGKLGQLISLCQKERPHVKWPELLFPAYMESMAQVLMATDSLRLDTALPSQVQQGRAFELAVSVRQPNSPILQEDDLDKTKSGDVKVNWPEDVKTIDLRVHVQAPECTVHGADSYAFQLFRGQDSPVFYFQLTPQDVGRIGIVVTVFQEQNWLGGTRLHTQVQEQVAGKVAMQIYSQPVGKGISHQAQVSVAREIETLFDLSELRTLCQDLDVLYGNLPGETQAEKARELVSYMVRRGRVLELLQICQELRPRCNWEALAGIITIEARIE